MSSNYDDELDAAARKCPVLMSEDLTTGRTHSGRAIVPGRQVLIIQAVVSSSSLETCDIPNYVYT
jgi:hypothetical protein